MAETVNVDTCVLIWEDGDVSTFHQVLPILGISRQEVLQWLLSHPDTVPSSIENPEPSLGPS